MPLTHVGSGLRVTGVLVGGGQHVVCPLILPHTPLGMRCKVPKCAQPSRDPVWLHVSTSLDPTEDIGQRVSAKARQLIAAVGKTVVDAKAQQYYRQLLRNIEASGICPRDYSDPWPFHVILWRFCIAKSLYIAIAITSLQESTFLSYCQRGMASFISSRCKL